MNFVQVSPISTSHLYCSQDKFKVPTIENGNSARLKHLKEMCADSPREMAIINALTTPYSRGFLNVSPSVRAGWFLRSEQFSAIVKYQLCSPVYGSDFTCPACNQKADKWSDHSLVCASYPERVNRHNNVRNFRLKLSSLTVL